MKQILIISAVCCIAGCAPLSQQMLDARTERQYERADWENRYRAYARRCSSAGGTMLVRETEMGQANLPKRGSFFQCSRVVGPIPRN